MTTSFFTRLTQEGAEDNLNAVIDTLSEIKASGITQLTANEFQKELKDKGMNSHLFQATQIFLESVEGLKNETYYDKHDKAGNPIGDLTIGIGLDLTKSQTSALALFYKPMPDVTWDKESKINPGKIAILTDEHLPDESYGDEFKNHLSEDQIYEIFYYTLIGVKNVSSETGTTYTYPGQIPRLIKILNQGGLGNYFFTPNQLISLLSLSFNSPNLIGPELIARLQELKDTGNDGSALLEIIECSNKNANACIAGVVGVQNRRLMEAALFHGDPEIVAMTMQQYNWLKKNCAGKDYAYVGSPSPYVIADYEKNYTGSDSAQPPVSGSSCHPTSTTYLGTNQPDKIEPTSNSNQTVFGGAGKDTVIVKPSSPSLTVALNDNDQTFTYLAGNEDDDAYYLTQTAGHVTIDDSDGVIYNDEEKAIRGLIFSTPTPYLYQFLGSSIFPNYNLNLIPSDYDQNVNQLKISWGDPQNDILINNFKSGNMDLILTDLYANPGCQVKKDYGKYSIKRLLTNNPAITGSYVAISFSSTATTTEVNANIVSPDGNILNQIPLFEINPQEFNSISFSKNSVAALNDERFVFAYQESFENSYIPLTEDKHDYYYLKAVFGSESDAEQPINLPLATPDGTCIFDHTTFRGCEIMSNPTISSNRNNFLAFYTLENQSPMSSYVLAASSLEKSTVLMTGSYYITPIAASLYDSNYVVGAIDMYQHALSFSILNSNSEIIRQIPITDNWDCASQVVAPTGQGFMVIGYNYQNPSLYGAIIYNGTTWSQPLYFTLNSKDKLLAAVGLPNNYVLLTSTCGFTLIDDMNQLVSQAALSPDLPCGAPVSVDLTEENNVVALYDKTTVDTLSCTYMDTASLQPQDRSNSATPSINSEDDPYAFTHLPDDSVTASTYFPDPNRQALKQDAFAYCSEIESYGIPSISCKVHQTNMAPNIPVTLPPIDGTLALAAVLARNIYGFFNRKSTPPIKETYLSSKAYQAELNHADQRLRKLESRFEDELSVAGLRDDWEDLRSKGKATKEEMANFMAMIDEVKEELTRDLYERLQASPLETMQNFFRPYQSAMPKRNIEPLRPAQLALPRK